MPQARKVVRQAGLEAQDLAGFGVLEAQYMGVQGLSAKGLRALARAFSGKQRRLGLEARAVGVVAEQRMADMGQMHPDLVGAAGLQPAGEQARDRLSVGSGVGFQQLPVGDRLAAVRRGPPACRAPCGWRSSGASIVPFGRSGAPQTKAR